MCGEWAASVCGVWAGGVGASGVGASGVRGVGGVCGVGGVWACVSGVGRVRAKHPKLC